MASVTGPAVNRVCDVHIGTSDEAVTLRAVISTVFSTLEIDEVLAGVVDIATEATGCHACLIYLLESDRLLLRAASPVHSRFVGQIEMERRRGRDRLGRRAQGGGADPRQRPARPAHALLPRARGGALAVDGGGPRDARARAT